MISDQMFRTLITEMAAIRAMVVANHAELIELAARLSEPSFAAIWDNPEDDVYNDL